MTDGYMHIAINAISDKPSGIWHFGFFVPSHEPIQAITKDGIPFRT